MEKGSMYVIVGTILSIIVTAGFGHIIEFATTPQFEIEHSSQNKIVKCPNIENWEKFLECDDDEELNVLVNIERITLKNTGLEQAKNVVLVLDSNGEGILTNIECPEGTYIHMPLTLNIK